MLDDVKMAFLNIGPGYKTWCTFKEVAINCSFKFAAVLSNAAADVGYDHPTFVKNTSAKTLRETGCS